MRLLERLRAWRDRRTGVTYWRSQVYALSKFVMPHAVVVRRDDCVCGNCSAQIDPSLEQDCMNCSTTFQYSVVHGLDEEPLNRSAERLSALYPHLRFVGSAGAWFQIYPGDPKWQLSVVYDPPAV